MLEGDGLEDDLVQFGIKLFMLREKYRIFSVLYDIVLMRFFIMVGDQWIIMLEDL